MYLVGPVRVVEGVEVGGAGAVPGNERHVHRVPPQDPVHAIEGGVLERRVTRPPMDQHQKVRVGRLYTCHHVSGLASKGTSRPLLPQ